MPSVRVPVVWSDARVNGDDLSPLIGEEELANVSYSGDIWIKAIQRQEWPEKISLGKEHTLGGGDVWAVNNHVDMVGTLRRESGEDSLNLRDTVLICGLCTSEGGGLIVSDSIGYTVKLSRILHQEDEVRTRPDLDENTGHGLAGGRVHDTYVDVHRNTDVASHHIIGHRLYQ